MGRLRMLSRCYSSLLLLKQRTACDMRISDWSSEVCSFDLVAVEGIVSAEGFVEQSRKALLRGGVGGCVSHMGASFLCCTIQAGRCAAGLPGTIPGGKTSRGTL